MATIVGPLLNADKISIARGDRDTHLTMLDLQPHGVPLLRNHCSCCVMGEVIDVMLTADGRTWAVATTDATRDRVDGLCFSLGGIPVDDEPADLVTPRQMVLTEISLVERSGSNTAPVRWQPRTLCSWDRGGYVTSTTASERQVLDHAASRLDFQRRAGVIEVVTLPDRTPATVTPVTSRTRNTAPAVDPFDPQPSPVSRDKYGNVVRTRYFAGAGWRLR